MQYRDIVKKLCNENVDAKEFYTKLEALFKGYPVVLAELPIFFADLIPDQQWIASAVTQRSQNNQQKPRQQGKATQRGATTPKKQQRDKNRDSMAAGADSEMSDSYPAENSAQPRQSKEPANLHQSSVNQTSAYQAAPQVQVNHQHHHHKVIPRELLKDFARNEVSLFLERVPLMLRSSKSSDNPSFL